MGVCIQVFNIICVRCTSVVVIDLTKIVQCVGLLNCLPLLLAQISASSIT